MKDAPALIEHALPVQRLSIEAYKEQMAGSGKTLTALGSYWKGRKPLILNKACILGCLLPATQDLAKDLEIFEMLMGMDDASLAKRLRLKEGESLPARAYSELVDVAKRPEEMGDVVHSHIWSAVNAHLGTRAASFPELVEQLGVMRFGHRPRLADTFCGSGQIPFEAARLGCDVLASDLNPVACMLTWGAFHVVGGTPADRQKLAAVQEELVERVRSEIDQLGIETDGAGWRAKVFLYCVEVRCPETGWRIPLLPTRIVSKARRAIAELIPNPDHKRYEIAIRSDVTDEELEAAASGTVRSDGRGADPYMTHVVEGIAYKTKITTLRGDYKRPDGSTGNRLRPWEIHDIVSREDDIFQERLYCVQWMRAKGTGKGDEYQFRAVTSEDLRRERVVTEHVQKHLSEWQQKGWVPDMRIEPGYNTDQPIRERAWTYWHHLFNPRQLLIGALVRQQPSAYLSLGVCSLLNCNSKLSRWHPAREYVAETFDNQALNTLLNYACQGGSYGLRYFTDRYARYLVRAQASATCRAAQEIQGSFDLFVTDPPYGDAVKYEEILEFFIAWLRRNPPPEFAKWTWDSRRSLAIKGEDEGFRRGMVAAYRKMTECLIDNGLQVIMFTHQSGSIWADMANIVWASGLRVTAAWYVVTETDSALREGSHVKGTILLVLRKRTGSRRTTRDDLAWDLQEEVERQVQSLTGLNQATKARYRDGNLFGDADVQMAGYAAALRVLTQYSIIDGKEMATEAIRPRVKGEVTFVDELIEFAVSVANRALVPSGIEKAHWDRLSPADRFYCKMLEMESRGIKTLDNYQNFAKAFKVADFKSLMASHKANAAALKSATQLGRSEMSEGSQMYGSVLRAVLYAIMELEKNVDGREVLAHLTANVPNWYGDGTQRELVVALSEYIASKLDGRRDEEAREARVLSELVKNQRIG